MDTGTCLEPGSQSCVDCKALSCWLTFVHKTFDVRKLGNTHKFKPRIAVLVFGKISQECKPREYQGKPVTTMVGRQTLAETNLLL